VDCFRANFTSNLTFTREVPAPSEIPHASHQVRLILWGGGGGEKKKFKKLKGGGEMVKKSWVKGGEKEKKK